MDEPYYRRNLALVHHLGFGGHAERCAPGILALLEGRRGSQSTVVELGCGSGLLTKHLVAGGHRVIATDASPALLDLCRAHVPGAAEVRQLVLPEDPIPEADAIVSVGHVLNYLPDEGAIERALVAMAGALRPGGLVAFDICDRSWGEARRGAPSYGAATDEWAIVTEFSVPAPDRFVRQMAVFVRGADGSWRRDDERHDNVLVDVARLPGFLAGHGLETRVGTSFGGEELPEGMYTVIGRKPAAL